jgi:hypothetical protein
MEDKVFVNGLIFKKPHQNAPSFVIASGSIKCSDMKAYMDEHQVDGWCNFQVKESKGGKYYADKDTFTPSKSEEYSKGTEQAKAAMAPADDSLEDDIPF